MVRRLTRALVLLSPVPALAGVSEPRVGAQDAGAFVVTVPSFAVVILEVAALAIDP